MGTSIPSRHLRHNPFPVFAFAAVGALLAVVVAAFAYSVISNLGPRSTPPIATVSPSPSASPSAVATPTPSPSPSPASVVAGLHGKLAISTGAPGSGGWITFPGGSFTADPKSNITLPDGGSVNGLAWNAAWNTWVPVNWYMIRQDGQVYAFVGWNYSGPAVMLVGKNGSPSLLANLPSNMYGYSVLSAEPEGVYVTALQGQGGLWRVDYSGGVHVVTATGFWQSAAFGYGYGTVTPSVPKGGTNVIRRIDLKTGAITDWFTVGGFQSRVVGLTQAGVPIIEASTDTLAEVWLGTAQPKLLHTETLTPSTANPPPYMGYQSQPPVYVVTALGDKLGIWVGTEGGLYLYSDQSGWELASTTTGQLGSDLQ